jgi:hypothetical protein
MADGWLIDPPTQGIDHFIDAHPLAAEDLHHLLTSLIGDGFGKIDHTSIDRHRRYYIDKYQYVK